MGITSEWSVEKDKYYREESENVKPRGECVPAGGWDPDAQGAPKSSNADFQQKRQQRDWYNNEADCLSAGHTWEPVTYQRAFKGVASPPPLVIQGEKSRINHLGNSQATYKKFESFMKEVCTDNTISTRAGNKNGCAADGKTGTRTYVDKYNRQFDDNVGGGIGASAFSWTVPNNVNGNCVLRLRYNISTWDFPGLKSNRYLGQRKFDATPGVDFRYNCQGNQQNGVPCTLISPVTQDPYVRIRPNAAGGAGAGIVSLALNTNQYARTFQDRTYVFEIRQRPTEIDENVNIVSLSVKGKRGNIVQTYPATEYDFQPSELVVNQDDYVHFQWTGSDYNPQRGCNNGEGGPPDTNGNQNLQAQIQAAANNGRADRNNIVFMASPGYNVPARREPDGTVGIAAGADIDLLVSDMYADDVNDGVRTPFDNVADAWDLAYIKQEAQISARGEQCLTQQQLQNINNQNRRENHPLNCAKLNAAVTPYFDGGVKKMANAGKFSAQSTRNNNFSNRDQTLKICVRTSNNDKSCLPKRDKHGIPKPFTEPPQGMNATFDGRPADSAGEPVSLLPDVDQETFAPIQKDNDSVGDGESQSCEERLQNFLASLSIGGIVAIAISMIAVGVLLTLVVQSLRGRLRKGQERDAWYRQKGNRV